MVFEGDSVKDMLILYSTLVGTNTSAEETEHLFEKLVESVQAIDPDFVPHLGTLNVRNKYVRDSYANYEHGGTIH